MSTSGSFWFPNSTAGADGRIDRAEVPPGTWTIVASVSRYRLAEIPDVELVEGGVRDLGTIELEPIPAFSGRVVRADGSSPGGACWVRARIAGNPSVETDEEGRFRLFADVPDRVAVDLFELLPSAGQDDRGVQRVLVEGWTIDVERELELAPWQRVEVRIGGPATDLPESSLVLWVCPAPDEPHGTCDHRDGFPRNHVPFLAASEVDPTEERRVFRFRTAPGRYQVYGRDLLHEVPAEVIEVRESDDLQVFELSSR